jgi:hypothetical protein
MEVALEHSSVGMVSQLLLDVHFDVTFFRGFLSADACKSQE